MKTVEPFERLSRDRKRLKHRLLLCLFLAILLLLAWTPLGYLPLGVLKLTLLHIPVLLGGFLLGMRAGAGLGLAFGVTSICINTLYPGLLSFAFSPMIPVYGQNQGSLAAILVALLPRILLGVFAGGMHLVFASCKKRKATPLQRPALWGIGFVGAALGTVLHTACVFALLLLCFGGELGALSLTRQMGTLRFLSAVCWVNGLPEALLAGILVPSLYLPLSKRLETWE